jgi:hypothetical protein
MHAIGFTRMSGIVSGFTTSYGCISVYLHNSIFICMYTGCPNLCAWRSFSSSLSWVLHIQALCVQVCSVRAHLVIPKPAWLIWILSFANINHQNEECLAHLQTLPAQGNQIVRSSHISTIPPSSHPPPSPPSPTSPRHLPPPIIARHGRHEGRSHRQGCEGHGQGQGRQGPRP